MPKIISSTTLRNGYNEVSAWCREKQEPVGNVQYFAHFDSGIASR